MAQSSALETVTLGASDLIVSRLGFGCWQLGGHGWQNLNQQDIQAAIHQALEKGINFFDTADIYGFGTSETILGDTLKTSPLGHDAIIASKFGVRMEDGKKWYDNSSAWLKSSLEGSLKRLGRDTIDLYMLHWHDGKRPLEDIFADLESLRQSGKIRWYGVSNMPFTQITGSRPAGLVSYSVEYSLIRRRDEKEETALEIAEDCSLIAWGGLAQGLLTGKYNRDNRFDKSDIRSRDNHIFVKRFWPAYEPLLHIVSEAAAAHDRSMAQTALRWILDSKPRSCTLAGIKHSRQLDENLGALGWQLDSHWLEKLDAASRTCSTLLEQK